MFNLKDDVSVFSEMMEKNKTEIQGLVPDFQRKARLPSLDETTGNALR